MEQPQYPSEPDFGWLDTLSSLMDSRFRVPGTSIRFGLDFIIGLFPGVGDFAGLAISGILVIGMARHGASGRVVAKMLGNILLDALAGLIPILGDLFDLSFKANRRNIALLREHYQEGRHQGNAWGVLIGAALLVLLALSAFAWLAIWAVSSVLGYMF